MPNRILREGIIGSLRISAVSPGAQLFFYKLISVVDDYGRFEAYPEVLRARCFSFELDRVTVADVTGWLAECGQLPANARQCPLITEYSVLGKKYLQINDFGQRERSERFPSPSLADKSEQMTAYARASNSNANTPTNSTTPPTSVAVLSSERPANHKTSQKANDFVAHGVQPASSEAFDGPGAPMQASVTPEQNPVWVVSRVAELYATAGRACSESHQQQAVQLLLSAPADRRIRLLRYVEGALVALWRNCPPRKLPELVSDRGEWDVEEPPKARAPTGEMRRKSRAEELMEGV